MEERKGACILCRGVISGKMEEYEPNPFCPVDLLLNILCIAYGYLHILFIGVAADGDSGNDFLDYPMYLYKLH